MSIYNYIEALDRLKLELIESLTKTEVDLLREDCTKLGKVGWSDWSSQHLKETLAFVAATPSKRHGLKKWREPLLKRRLVLAGLEHLNHAHNLLTGIESHWLFEGNSYREMASKAAFAYLDIFYVKKVSEWPFDDPDPFQ